MNPDDFPSYAKVMTTITSWNNNQNLYSTTTAVDYNYYKGNGYIDYYNEPADKIATYATAMDLSKIRGICREVMDADAYELVRYELLKLLRSDTEVIAAVGSATATSLQLNGWKSVSTFFIDNFLKSLREFKEDLKDKSEDVQLEFNLTFEPVHTAKPSTSDRAVKLV